MVTRGLRPVLVFTRSGPGVLYIEGNISPRYERPVIDRNLPRRVDRYTGFLYPAVRNDVYTRVTYACALPEGADWIPWGRVTSDPFTGEQTLLLDVLVADGITVRRGP